jgi:Transposase DDE domain/Domain of unknown function (DUF4372)
MKQHRKGLSLFQLIERKKFDALVSKWEVDKGVRKFTTWEMTQALICCFVLRLESFREVEGILGVSHSTFGESLQKRHFGFFQELCDVILLELRARTEDRKVKQAVRHLLAIDATDIRVHGSLFRQPGWKQKSTHGRQAAIKLHAIWDINGQWIDDFLITPGRCGESPTSHRLRLSGGKMYVFDRAYIDYVFWKKIVKKGSHFVTRLKTSKRRRVLEMQVSGDSDSASTVGVLIDRLYKSTAGGAKGVQLQLRHIVYRDPKTKKFFHFVTSDLEISAEEVADIYKRRWAVELLFRWLKGHLNVRYLPTRTPNSVQVQLAVALIVQLLLQMKKIMERSQNTLWEILRELRMSAARRTLAKSEVPVGCRWRTKTKARCAA